LTSQFVVLTDEEERSEQSEQLSAALMRVFLWHYLCYY